MCAGKASEVSVRNLSRGGILVEASDLRFQIGSYPETIKDTMPDSKGVPSRFVLPDILFDACSGVSAADLEFPLYYHFFIKGKKLQIVLHRRQLKPLLKLLKEAIFGPNKLNLTSDFSSNVALSFIPDLAREMAYYKLDPSLPKGRQCLKDMIELKFFDSKGEISLGASKLVSLGNNHYRLVGPDYEKEFYLAPITKPAHGSQAKPFYPPNFGLTIIGNGHGFDVDSKTSGFILWIQSKGILVDPPVHTTSWLEQQGIDSRLITNIILTHCHSDHDSGTLQKVFQEGRIRIHTTPTIIKSFTNKYCSLLGLKSSELAALFEYGPVMIGSPVSLLGAEFNFHYTLHPIPTIGFLAKYEGKSFYYSCDTLYDPEQLEQLRDEGLLSEQRFSQLASVPWQSDLVLHEAGIPPIHTPTKVLAQLPDEVKSHLLLTHISKSAIPEGSGLKLAQPGVENSVRISCPTANQNELWQIVEAISSIDVFSELNPEKIATCLSATGIKSYAPGELIIKKNSPGNDFFVVLEGLVEVMHEALPQPVFATRYDYFGETAIVTGQPRNADVIARSEVKLLCISKTDFLRLVNNTSVNAKFTRLAANRAKGARWLFEKNPTLAAFTALQKNQLLCCMQSDVIAANTVILAPEMISDQFYLIDSGLVKIELDKKSLTFGPGELLGLLSANEAPARHNLKATALTDLWVYTISSSDLEDFFRSNPGTFVKLYQKQTKILSKLASQKKLSLGA